MSASGLFLSATLLARTSAVGVLPVPVAMAKMPLPPALLQARMASAWYGRKSKPRGEQKIGSGLGSLNSSMDRPGGGF